MPQAGPEPVFQVRTALKDSRYGFSATDATSSLPRNVSNQGQHLQAIQFISINLTHSNIDDDSKNNSSDNSSSTDSDSTDPDSDDDDSDNDEDYNDNDDDDDEDQNDNNNDDDEDQNGNNIDEDHNNNDINEDHNDNNNNGVDDIYYLPKENEGDMGKCDIQTDCTTAWFIPPIVIDETSPSEDEAEAQAALRAFPGNMFFQLQL